MAIFTLAMTDAGLWAPRFTGTFTTDGTMSVVGIGTEFASSLVGQSFRFVGSSTDYTIASVTDATHLETTAAIPAGSGQVAFLSSNPQGLIDANFHLLGSAALADSGDFQPYNAGATLLGNTTTGSGSIVCNASPTLTTPTIASLIGNKISPASDGTAALQFNKADSMTNVVTIDTTNSYVGVGCAPTMRFCVGTPETTVHGETYYNRTIGLFGATGAYYLARDTTNNVELVFGTSVSGYGWLATMTNHPFVFRVNNSVEVMRITTASRLGLGVSDPNAKFEISRAAADVMASGSGANTTAFLRLQNNSGGIVGDMGLQSSSPYGLWIQATHRDYLNNTYPILLNPIGGNVGIGTSAPNAKLESLSTMEQLRLSYDSTHYASWTTNSSGNLTIAPSGGTTAITGAMTIGSSGQATITSGGYAQLGWGTASTPAFSFSSAANYGIYYASGAVRISAAGSEVARFSASGCTVSGSVTATQFKLSALNTAPSSSSDTGALGEIRIVNGYIYICVATNTWQRAALASW